jgi:hypothetical protein
MKPFLHCIGAEARRGSIPGLRGTRRGELGLVMTAPPQLGERICPADGV